jgi:hypothetical protein
MRTRAAAYKDGRPLFDADCTEILDVHAVDIGLHLRLEVFLVLHDARDNEFLSRAPRHANGVMRAWFRWGY